MSINVDSTNNVLKLCQVKELDTSNRRGVLIRGIIGRDVYNIKNFRIVQK